jgi:hypothetical protein
MKGNERLALGLCSRTSAAVTLELRLTEFRWADGFVGNVVVGFFRHNAGVGSAKIARQWMLQLTIFDARQGGADCSFCATAAET